jgi:crotonobetainyl-CoA:carnitine CoA-transferase CaiB-like acyl-CoA transferase
MCGMYASSAILAALHHRQKTGEGQHIDLALLDTQVAWLTYEGLNYLTSGELPKRRGNEHPNIVPYKTMPASDGYFILAVGNDSQFAKFCDEAGREDLAQDPRFTTNAERVRNREALYPILDAITATRPLKDWVDALNARGVPSGPVNTLDRVFADPQIQHRNMQIQMDYPEAAKGKVDLIGNPIGFSGTQVSYRQAPPKMGEHTDAVLHEALGLSAEQISALRDRGVI